MSAALAVSDGAPANTAAACRRSQGANMRLALCRRLSGLRRLVRTGTAGGSASSARFSRHLSLPVWPDPHASWPAASPRSPIGTDALAIPRQRDQQSVHTAHLASKAGNLRCRDVHAGAPLPLPASKSCACAAPDRRARQFGPGRSCQHTAGDAGSEPEIAAEHANAGRRIGISGVIVHWHRCCKCNETVTRLRT